MSCSSVGLSVVVVDGCSSVRVNRCLVGKGEEVGEEGKYNRGFTFANGLNRSSMMIIMISGCIWLDR